MQNGTLVTSTTYTQKTRLRERTDRAWFSRLVRHLASKRSGSILTTPETARGYTWTCIYGTSLWRWRL